MNFISLGSNCSVTYQMIKYNIRTYAYPFDWCALTINQLIKILENDFLNYYESLKIKKISDKHLDYNGKQTPTLILTNDYNIKYAHEIVHSEDLEEFKGKIKRRIDRLNNINDKIIFIRIELKKINECQVYKLIDILDTKFNNYELRLILCHNLNICHTKIKIFNYNYTFQDWKMNQFDWETLLSS